MSDAQSRRGSRKKSVGFEDSSKQPSDALLDIRRSSTAVERLEKSSADALEEQSARETLQWRETLRRVAAAARLQARTRAMLGPPPPVKVETFEEGEEKELVVEELVEEEAVETAAAEEEDN